MTFGNGLTLSFNNTTNVYLVIGMDNAAGNHDRSCISDNSITVMFNTVLFFLDSFFCSLAIVTSNSQSLVMKIKFPL